MACLLLDMACLSVDMTCLLLNMACLLLDVACLLWYLDCFRIFLLPDFKVGANTYLIQISFTTYAITLHIIINDIHFGRLSGMRTVDNGT